VKNDRNGFKTINVNINDQNIIFMTRRQRNRLNKTFLIRVDNITGNIRSYAKLMILFVYVFCCSHNCSYSWFLCYQHLMDFGIKMSEEVALIA
jgi:hypothetical protein